jgi:hypothetical protein
MIRVLELSITEFADIVKDLKSKGYTLDEIENMVVLE